MKLDNYPGWRDWRRKKMGLVLNHPEEKYFKSQPIGDFHFDRDTEAKRDLISRWYSLGIALELFSETQFYFRRYPFRGLPISHRQYFNNNCEMYFNRIYEFKERAEKLSKTLGRKFKGDIDLLKGVMAVFYDTFQAELEERRLNTHDERFSTIEIDYLLMADLMVSAKKEDMGWKREHDVAYRTANKVWIERINEKVKLLRVFEDGMAEFILMYCPFLREEAEASEREATAH